MSRCISVEFIAARGTLSLGVGNPIIAGAIFEPTPIVQLSGTPSANTTASYDNAGNTSMRGFGPPPASLG
jgi:hypothetical protein